MVKRFNVDGPQHADRGNSYTKPTQKISKPKPPKPKKK
jgi:hypothetical protein